MKGYVNTDPATKHQKCLPIGFFKKLIQNKASTLTTAIGQLAVGALFFGMRSCEYSKVHGDRKTKLLTVKDIRFFRGRKEIKKDISTFYNRATSVSICFRMQKNDEKEAVVTMHRSSKGLCPVKTWGEIVDRVLSYPRANQNSPVNLVEIETTKKPKYVQIRSSDILKHIRNTVTQIGEDKLGFTAKEVGTHSIRSSFAMFLHLNGIRSDKIMLQGRWRSTAFLTYIRVQVTEFSLGLSDKMNKTRDFYTVPEDRYDHTGQHYYQVDHNVNRQNTFPTHNPGIMAF